MHNQINKGVNRIVSTFMPCTLDLLTWKSLIWDLCLLTIYLVYHLQNIHVAVHTYPENNFFKVLYFQRVRGVGVGGKWVREAAYTASCTTYNQPYNHSTTTYN